MPRGRKRKIAFVPQPWIGSSSDEEQGLVPMYEIGRGRGRGRGNARGGGDNIGRGRGHGGAGRGHGGRIEHAVPYGKTISFFF